MGDYALDRICDMMYCELEDMGKKEKLDSKDVDLIYKFVDIVKDIGEIESSYENGYSQTGSSYARMRTPMYRGRGSSYGNGYSRTSNRDEMIDRLQDIANMAMDEKDRKAVDRLISQMESQ